MRAQVNGHSIRVLRGLWLHASGVLMTLTQLIVQIELHSRLSTTWLAQYLLLIMIRNVERLNAASVLGLLEASLGLMTSHNLTVACDTAASRCGDT